MPTGGSFSLSSSILISTGFGDEDENEDEEDGGLINSGQTVIESTVSSSL
jgi:hypothetical protein